MRLSSHVHYLAPAPFVETPSGEREKNHWEVTLTPHNHVDIQICNFKFVLQTFCTRLTESIFTRNSHRFYCLNIFCGDFISLWWMYYCFMLKTFPCKLHNNGLKCLIYCKFIQESEEFSHLCSGMSMGIPGDIPVSKC